MAGRETLEYRLLPSIKKKIMAHVLIIDKGKVIDIKREILNFLFIDTEFQLVKCDKGQL